LIESVKPTEVEDFQLEKERAQAVKEFVQISKDFKTKLNIDQFQEILRMQISQESEMSSVFKNSASFTREEKEIALDLRRKRYDQLVLFSHYLNLVEDDDSQSLADIPEHLGHIGIILNAALEGKEEEQMVGMDGEMETIGKRFTTHAQNLLNKIKQE